MCVDLSGLPSLGTLNYCIEKAMIGTILSVAISRLYFTCNCT